MLRISIHRLTTINKYRIKPSWLIINVLFSLCLQTVKAQDCLLIPLENIDFYTNYEKTDSILQKATSSQKKLVILTIESNLGGFSTELFELDSLGQYNFSVFEGDTVMYSRKGELLNRSFFNAPLSILGPFQTYSTTSRYFHQTKTILVCADGEFFSLTSLDGKFFECLYHNQLYLNDFTDYFNFADSLKDVK